MAFMWGDGFGTPSTDVANVQFKIFIGQKQMELRAMESSGRIPLEILEKGKKMGLENALLAPLPEIAGNGKMMDIDSGKLFSGLKILAGKIAEQHSVPDAGPRGMETDMRQAARKATTTVVHASGDRLIINRTAAAKAGIKI